MWCRSLKNKGKGHLGGERQFWEGRLLSILLGRGRVGVEELSGGGEDAFYPSLGTWGHLSGEATGIQMRTENVGESVVLWWRDQSPTTGGQ